jgi:hypothetical protein
MRVEFWANHTGIKSEMLLGTIGGTTWELKELMGTRGKRQKIPPPSFAKKKKDRTPHESMLSRHWLHGTFVSKSVYVTIFGLA